MSEPEKRPRPDRLKNRRDFLRVAKSGKKWVSPGLIVQVDLGPDAANNGDGNIRVGFTVSKKVGNAVERNRVRRRLRAIADRVLPAEGRRGRDYVVIGRKAALERPFVDLTQDMTTAVRKIERRHKIERQHGEKRRSV